MQHSLSFLSSFSSSTTPPKEVKQKSKAASEKKPKEKNNNDIPRALSAYTLFIKEQAASRKGTGKGATFLQELAQEWKALPDAQKEPYQQQAAAMKSSSSELRAANKAAKAPGSAYNQWCKEEFVRLNINNPGLKGVEYIRLAAQSWKALPEAEKAARKDAAAKAREDWKQQQQQAQQHGVDHTQ
eukprot:gene7968-8166_t